jgi:hypothetical protein
MAAISATFTANFSNFQQAVEQAQITIKDFGVGADTVGTKLNAMVDNFSGRKLIQQATELSAAIEQVGGVAALTDQELQKWGPTFDAAIAKMEKTGQAVPEQWKAITDAADKSAISWEHLGETITKAFENPIGAMKEFGATFGESIVAELGSVGAIAVGAVTGIVAVGAALFELADKAAEAGAGLQDMSDKTGMSVPALSNLSNAMSVAGGDMGTMGNALFMVGKNLEENTTKFQEGLGRIGLTTEQLKAAGPDQYLSLIASGLDATADSSTRAAAAAEIFGGRIGREMIPTLLKLGDAQQLVADIRPWTEQEAKDAEAFNMQIQSMKVHVEALGTAFGRSLIGPLGTVIDYTKTAITNWITHNIYVQSAGVSVRVLGEAYGYAAAALLVFKGGAVDMAAAYKILGIQTADAAAKVKQAADDAFDKSHSPAALLAASKQAVDDWTKSTSDLSINTIDLSKNLAAQSSVTKDLDAQYAAVHKDSVEAAAAAQKYADAIAGYNAAGASYAKVLDAIGNEMYEGIAYDLKRGATTDELTAAYGASKLQIDMVKRSEADYATAQREAYAATEATATSMEKFEAINDKAAKSVTAGPQTVLLTLSQTMGDVNLASQNYKQGMGVIADGSVYAAAHMQTVTDTAIGLEKEIDQGLAGALERLPGELTHAFASGNIGQAFGSIAQQFVDVVEKPILKSLGTVQQAAVSAGTGGAAGLGAAVGGNVGAIVGGTAASLGGAALAASSFGTAMAGSVAGAVALGAATMGIGAAAVGVVMLIKHFTGLSQTIKDGRAAEAAFEQQFGGSQQMIDAVGAAYTNMGKSSADAQADIQALFKAENSGAPATAAAIAKINDVLTASATKTQAVATGVDAITSATQTLGGTAPAALQPLIKTLESMPGITADEKTALDGLLGSGTTDYDALTKMASGYGITLDELGPKFQQADISKQADQIVKDFGSLIDAGADAGGVLSGMADEVSTLVDNAIKYGSTLPTALKPIIDNLVAAGQLTDDTGKKLDDVSQIKFADTNDPLAQGIDNLTQAINDLISTLGGLPKSAADAASGMAAALGHVDVPPVVIPYSYQQQGAGPGAQAAEYHAEGGVVGFPGAPRGTDTVPAWLTPGEQVLTVPQQHALAASASGPSAITIVTPLIVDGREIGRAATTYQSRNLQARRKLSAA